MSLTACSDISPADWIVGSALPWSQLVTFGPSGFAASARLRHLPDPAYEGQSENDAAIEGTWWEDHDQLATLLQVLGAHTQTPDDCYVCVWDGYTDHGHTTIHRDEFLDSQGGMPLWYPDEASSATMPHPSPLAQPAPHPAPPPPPEWPQVVVPNRAYFLFYGQLADARNWDDDVELWAGQTRLHPPHPAFVWPADHAWCIASDVDPHYSGIGANTPVINQLVNDPRLDVVRADPDADQPEYR